MKVSRNFKQYNKSQHLAIYGYNMIVLKLQRCLLLWGYNDLLETKFYQRVHLCGRWKYHTEM